MPEAEAGRELFVYWRLAPGDRASALAAVNAWLTELRARHAGLQVRVYLRADPTPPWLTLMETFALPAGIGPELEREIREGGTRALSPWVQGERHVEVFQRLS
jgi:hypothetical protein